ncbi:MAG: hypothetical protein JWO50_488 [Candidatus Kaiserbacteria bacterium]|nr:hypothetical protein [Candidatus Kaiserbacteria bacterium]
MPIYVPKEIVELTPTMESPLLFLAGPIRGGNDWQAEGAEEILDQEPSAHIVCPSRWDKNHRLARHFYKPFTQAANRQLEFERHYLRQAGIEPFVPGCVIFCLPCERTTDPHPGPEPYAMDTRREFGKFTAYCELMGVRMVVGGDRNFYGLDVMLYELNAACEREVTFHTNMMDLVADALQTARQRVSFLP